MSAPNNPVVIIQSRMGSTRLPGKVMMKIAGKMLIDWVIDGAKDIKNAADMVVAVPENREDDVLAAHIAARGIKCFRGSAEDVLARFYHAAVWSNANPVIRLCADSPLPGAGYMDLLIEGHIGHAADLTHCATLFPLGSAGEAISFAALERMFREARTKHCREHVTPFIHENPREFRIHKVQPPVWMQRDFRLTIDTGKDMEMMETLFGAVRTAGMEVNFTNAMAILDARPEIALINAAEKQRDWRRE